MAAHRNAGAGAFRFGKQKQDVRMDFERPKLVTHRSPPPHAHHAAPLRRMEVFRTLLMQRVAYFDVHSPSELAGLIGVELDAVRAFVFR